ncbi:Protein kinase [Phytophthora megakarya]|uniref:Protein kinase n=1 Tax=Phytophthora megakarya TaxID=4795 RepID=A0A225X4Q8_9STRA|nr:Protein kinase [Phytophthora megakarya]
MSTITHLRLGSTGNLPLFNTRGTERFETSSTSGGYGEVYRGVYRDEVVAVKVLLPEKQKDMEQINAFLAEIKMMASIDHPCIVRFLGVAWDSLSDLSAVMEFMAGGDLRALLDRFHQENRPRGFNLDKARIALQTAQALTYLHSLDPIVLHRDFKSRNILLTSELEAKLSDFGVARKYNFTNMTAAVGTSLWMAPEVMLGDRYDASADIFSFGVVLSELDSHLNPSEYRHKHGRYFDGHDVDYPDTNDSHSDPNDQDANANTDNEDTNTDDENTHPNYCTSGDYCTSYRSTAGVSTGAVLGIVAGAVVLVLLIAGFAFWLYRRRKQKMSPRSPSFDASYAIAPVTLPAADPIILESYTPAPPMAVQDLNNFDRTVDLESTANLDSTLRLDSSTSSIPTTKMSTKSGSLWEDEAITAARIPMEKLIRKELVNEGGHGEVYHGLYRGECVAIKVLLPEKRKDMRQINIFLSEIKMMATVEHPRIVRFVGVAWDALSDLCAVSEFMPGGDLFSLLRRFDRVDHRSTGFDGDKAKIATHVAQALTYLHSLDPIVLHRDLKSMNILLSEDWEAKLTDFGVSRKWTVDTMTAGVGTRRWMAPEVMMGKRYNTSADIFSFGVVLSELDSHQPPYASAIATITSESGEKVTETALMEMVAMGRVRVEFSPNAPAALVNLGHACVDLDPRARPTAGEVHYELQKILRRYQKYTL